MKNKSNLKKKGATGTGKPTLTAADFLSRIDPHLVGTALPAFVTQ